MKTKLAIIFALVTWFAVIMQYVLMINERTLPLLETTIRFFSYFTILTNILVATYLTYMAVPINKRPSIVAAEDTMTAITVYITVVGSSYQVLLRHVWQPQGMQLVVNELLHSVIPILMIIFWYMFESNSLQYSRILRWSIYPLVYLVFILIRGHYSDFYPYYFVDVNKLGIQQTLLTSAALVVVFVVISAIFIFITRSILSRRAVV